MDEFEIPFFVFFCKISMGICGVERDNILKDDDPEGWDGEGGGRGFWMRNTCTPMAIHVNVWQNH